MTAPTSFSTARLRAHRGGPADVDFVASMFADERVTATLGGPRSRREVVDALTRWDRHWETRGFGPWILSDLATFEPVGWLLLHHTETGGADGVELGWSIAADRWREGLASEAAAEALRIAFTDVGLDEIVTFTLVDNVASRGVMEKIGFVYDCDVVHADLPHVLYRLDRKTWEHSMGEMSNG